MVLVYMCLHTSIGGHTWLRIQGVGGTTEGVDGGDPPCGEEAAEGRCILPPTGNVFSQVFKSFTLITSCAYALDMMVQVRHAGSATP